MQLLLYGGVKSLLFSWERSHYGAKWLDTCHLISSGIYMYMRCSCTLPPIPVNCILYLKIGLQDINFYQVRNTVAK